MGAASNKRKPVRKVREEWVFIRDFGIVSI
jgi:hypothetical protein